MIATPSSHLPSSVFYCTYLGIKPEFNRLYFTAYSTNMSEKHPHQWKQTASTPRLSLEGEQECSYCSLMHLPPISFSSYHPPPSSPTLSPLGIASTFPPSRPSFPSPSFLSNSHTPVLQLCTHFHCGQSFTPFFFLTAKRQSWCWDAEQWLNISFTAKSHIHTCVFCMHLLHMCTLNMLHTNCHTV